MKSILLSMFLTLFAIGHITQACSVKENDFNYKQKQILRNAFEIGESHELQYYKGNDIGLIFAAIAWQESCAGLKLERPSDPSHKAYGVFQNHIKTLRTRAKRANLGLTDEELRKMVIDDMYFASSFSYMELRDWDKIHRGNKQKILASYYAGYGYANHYWYANAVQAKINWLKKNDFFVKNYTEEGFIK